MEINDYAADYEAATQFFLDQYATVSPGDLDRHQVEGWSPRQVIHHMADSEAQSYARLRRLIAEPTDSLIQGYDEAMWANNPVLGYTELPVENSVAVFIAVRAASLDILKRLTLADLSRSGIHTEAGHYEIKDWLRAYTNHPRAHANQMMEAIGK